MADERRRLIYELMVEAVGTAAATKKAEDDMKRVGAAAADMGAMMTKALGFLGVGLTLKGVAEALSQTQKLSEQMKVLGLTSTQSAQALTDVQDVAIATGQSFESVTALYGRAIRAAQLFGETQSYARHVTEAFTKAMVGQGGSAEQAAEQLEMLQLAYSKNNLKVKEFQGLMKSNEVLQDAAAEALGKNTEQLLKMAAAGEIGQEQIKKILDRFVELSKNIEVGTTLDRITNSAKVMFQVFVDGIGQTSGLKESLKGFSSDDAGPVITFFRSLAEGAGGVLRVIKNLVDEVANVALLINDVVLFGPLEAWNRFQKRWMDDAREGMKGMEDVGHGVVTMFTGGVQQGIADTKLGGVSLSDEWSKQMSVLVADADKAGKAASAGLDPVAQAALDVWAAAQKMPHPFKETFASILAETGGIKRFNKESTSFYDNMNAAAARIADMPLNIDAVGDGLAKAVESSSTFSDTIKELEAQTWSWSYALEQAAAQFADEFPSKTQIILQAAQVLQNAFASIFTDAVHNARDFFRVVAAGFTQMFAQLAAQAAASSILDFLRGMVGMRSGLSGGLHPFAPDAKGNAYGQGRVIPMAAGGVVTGPTLFPLAAGNVGMMGEAGAEAVMPLRRTKSGRLGVEAAGAPRVTVENHGPPMEANVLTSDDETRIVLRAAQLGSDLARANLTQSIASGYGPSAQAFQRTYGLKRRG